MIVDDPSFPNSVRVTDSAQIEKDHKVLVELDPWNDPYKSITGTIIEDLGEASAPGVDIDSLLKAAGVDEAFPDHVLKEAKNIPAAISDDLMNGRRDLRSDVIFTIDPETARDFDDAISIDPHPQGGLETWSTYCRCFCLYNRRQCFRS